MGYMLWWFEKGNGVGGVVVVVKIRSMCDRVIAVVLVFDEDVLRLICGNLCKAEEVWKKNNLFMLS